MSVYEEGFIGGLFYNHDDLMFVSQFLAPSDFTNEFLKQIYIAFIKLSESGSPVDLNTISTFIAPNFQNINVYTDLLIFESNNKIKLDVIYYARQIADLSKRRDLGMMLEKAARDLASNKPTGEILEGLTGRLHEVHKSVHVEQGYELYELMQRLMEQKDSEIDGEKIPLRLLTHYPSLDEIIGGFKAGNLVTVAANSGGGKSTFGLNILKNIALNTLTPVMLLSLEMNEDEITSCALASISKTSLNTINSDIDTNREFVLRLANAARIDLSKNNVQFKIWCTSDGKFHSAVRVIREHIREVPKCKIVMIDYPGLMDASLGKNANRVQEIQYITRTLKNLAMELDIVILIMAQTNRENKDEINTPFKLKDLRDSASIGHDSNTVMFIQPTLNENQVKINVEKNRGGKRGCVTLGFDRERANFYDLRYPNGDD